MRYLNGYAEMARRFIVGKSGEFGRVTLRTAPSVPDPWSMTPIDENNTVFVYFFDKRRLAQHAPILGAHPAMVVFSPVTFFWQKWNEETESHINRILRAMRHPMRVNHVEARAKRAYRFTVGE